MNRWITFFFLFLTTGVIHADSRYTDSYLTDNYQVGRYTSVSTEAAEAQVDLLAVIVEIQFPHQIDTVGSAYEYLLLDSGFKLASLHASDPSLPKLFNLNLPGIHRHLGPMSLETALNTLAGSSWTLIEDSVNRLISFELKNQFVQSGDYQ